MRYFKSSGIFLSHSFTWHSMQTTQFKTLLHFIYLLAFFISSGEVWNCFQFFSQPGIFLHSTRKFCKISFASTSATKLVHDGIYMYYVVESNKNIVWETCRSADLVILRGKNKRIFCISYRYWYTTHISANISLSLVWGCPFTRVLPSTGTILTTGGSSSSLVGNIKTSPKVPSPICNTHKK